MIVECTNNAAFEDYLTVNKQYTVKDKKGCSVQIENDKGEDMWFGCQKFIYKHE